MFQQVLRAHRQMMMVRSKLPDHTFMSSFHILCVSFFFINTLPLRMGEVVRPILFFEREQLPFGAASAIVFLERIIDLISALMMLLLVLGFANILSSFCTDHSAFIPSLICSHNLGASLDGRRAAAVRLVQAKPIGVMVHLMRSGKPARFVFLLTESVEHKRLLFLLEF